MRDTIAEQRPLPFKTFIGGDPAAPNPDDRPRLNPEPGSVEELTAAAFIAIAAMRRHGREIGRTVAVLRGVN